MGGYADLDARRDYLVRYRTEHREELAAQQRHRHARDPEPGRSRQRNLTPEQRKRRAERAAQWRRDHPDEVRALRRRHKLKRKLRDPEAVEYAALISTDPCAYCGGPGGTIDHIDPLDGGGTNTWDNLAPACFRCNQSKSARPMLLWMLSCLR